MITVTRIIFCAILYWLMWVFFEVSWTNFEAYAVLDRLIFLFFFQKEKVIENIIKKHVNPIITELISGGTNFIQYY